MRLRSVLTCVLVLGVSAFLGCAGSKTAPTRSPRERALALVEASAAALREKDYTGAFEFLTRAEAIEAELPELHHTRAIVYYTQKHFAEAIACAQKAVSFRETYWDAWTTLGRLQMEAGNPQEAERSLKKASSDLGYRDVFKPFTNLGILYYRRGEMKLAEDAFERAVRIDPVRSCHANYYLGHIQLARNQLMKASDFYHAATLRACGGFADAHLALGIAFQRQREYPKARQKFMELARLFPGSVAASEAAKRLRGLP